MKSLNLEVKLLESKEELDKLERGDRIIIYAVDYQKEKEYLGIASYNSLKRSSESSVMPLFRFIGIVSKEKDISFVEISAYENEFHIRDGGIYTNCPNSIKILRKNNKKYLEEFKMLKKAFRRNK